MRWRFPLPSPPTLSKVLFSLGVVVGPAGLFQLGAEIFFLQLSGIADHKLLGKVLHGKRRENTMSDRGKGTFAWTPRFVYSEKELEICLSGCVELCKSESESLHVELENTKPTCTISFTSVLSVLILALCSPLTFSPIQVMRVNLARLLMASPVVILTKPKSRLSSESQRERKP